MAWFLLASLVPLALGLTALASVLLGDYGKAQALAERMAKVLPKDVHAEVVELILRTRRESPLLVAGSIAGMLWTSSGAVGVLRRCLSRLLDRDPGGFVVGKLRNLAMAAGVTLLTVLAVIVASAGTGLAQRLGLPSVLLRVGVPMASLAAAALVCSGVYWTLAGGDVRRQAALTGGLVAGLMLLVTPAAAGYYLRFVAGETPVEVFLVLAGVLCTCYLAAFSLVIGAGVTVRVHLRRRLAEAQ